MIKNGEIMTAGLVQGSVTRGSCVAKAKEEEDLELGVFTEGAAR